MTKEKLNKAINNLVVMDAVMAALGYASLFINMTVFTFLAIVFGCSVFTTAILIIWYIVKCENKAKED